MAGSSNFLQHNPTAANQESDATYATDSTRTGGIGEDQIMPSAWMNKIWYQSSTFVTAFAQALANKGYAVSDASLTTLESVLANVLTNADLKAALVAVPFSPTPNFNCAISNGFQINMSGNVTGATFSGWSPGQIINLVIVQGATAYTFAAPAAVNQWPLLGVNMTPNSVTVISLIAREDNQLYGYLQTQFPFNPIQQGGGIGQNSTTANVIKVGWSGTRLKATVDTTDLGNVVFDTQLNAATGPLNTEITNLTNTFDAFVAKFLSSLGNSGYVKIPTTTGQELIIQWGFIGSDLGSGVNVVNFPIAFATQCYTVVASTTGGTDRISYVISWNANSFQIANNGSGTSASWVAFGI
jgi:hypothetical protein